ncbi:MAG: electron transport complex subunit RsxG [Reinekea sp.]|jgi:Na+-translocating ferredoxin:NAD+ oxidoreductase subunit G
MTKNNDTITISESIRKSAIGLAIFAFFTAGIISVTQYLTKETISSNEKNFEARLLLSLLPDGYGAEQILNNAQRFSDFKLTSLDLLNVEDSEVFYQLKDDQGRVETLLLPAVAPEGYTEAIRLVIGISTQDGHIIGARVTKHKETPGLGDRIEITKSDWMLGFNDKSLQNPQPENWKVKKDGGDFDQMTGATITPRAVVKAIKQALEFFEQNKAALTNS